MRAFPTVDVWELKTPWKRALRTALGPVDLSLVSNMESLGYDYAPVMVGRKSIGLVPRSRLQELGTAGLSLREDDESIIRLSVAGEADLEEILAAVQPHGAASVGIGTLLGDAGSGGFFTLADLNKHPFRAAVYPLFAELESELALLAGNHFRDPWTWLSKLDKDRQARLVGYWELSKRDGVDVGPLAGTTLSELSKIIGLAEPLRAQLGFASKGKWDDFFGSLVHLRNSVMHPVRPLFTTTDEVEVVYEQLAKVLDLLNRIDGEPDEESAEAE
jgi:hypothetical protein